MCSIRLGLEKNGYYGVMSTTSNGQETPIDASSGSSTTTVQPSRIGPLSATDLLLSIYKHPAPYTTVYLTTQPLQSTPDTAQRWRALRANLEAQGAPPEAIQAIEARLSLPQPDDTAAIAVVAASDGATIVDHGLEPPAVDYGVVAALPYAGPLLEWHQRRIPHIVVTADEDGADIVLFGSNHYHRLDQVDTSSQGLAESISERQEEIGAVLVVIAGANQLTGALADRLRMLVPLNCRIVTEPLDIMVDDLADVTVRHVSDTAARTTVRILRERRFLDAHDAAVDGIADTIEALSHGTPDLILVHDNPDDRRQCWIGSHPQQISLIQGSDHTTQARLVDAIVWSALGQGIGVHIIPTTGDRGPEDDTAAITRIFNIGPGVSVAA